jgi:hypothetical protein
MGKVFVAGEIEAVLYQIAADPFGNPAVNSVASGLGQDVQGIAYDGQRVWTAQFGNGVSGGSVSIVTLNPVTVTNVTTGFSSVEGILFDGSNIWVTDFAENKLKKLNSTGGILLLVSVGTNPRFPVFDGINIWVPNSGSNTVTVVRATGSLAGTVLATLSGNGLNGPTSAAFDGERILVTNPAGDSVSLWNATDLTPIGNFSTGSGSQPFAACSDGVNFWITLIGAGQLARF